MRLARVAHIALFLGLFFLAKTQSSAENTTPSATNAELQSRLSGIAAARFNDPLRGIVVNRTVTVQGHEFYRYFSMWWHHNPDASNYSISIHERPSARWGSEIWVDYHHTRIFHMFLPPARSRTKEISREAAASSLQRIEDNELEKAFYQNIDLGPEEM